MNTIPTQLPVQMNTIPTFNIQSNAFDMNMPISSNIPEFKPHQSNIMPSYYEATNDLFTDDLGSKLGMNEPRDSYEDYGLVESVNTNKCNLLNYCTLPTMKADFNINNNTYAPFK